MNSHVPTKCATSAPGEDLQIALDEGATDPKSILALFSADDWVRCLDARELWAYCVEGELWTVEAGEKQ